MLDQDRAQQVIDHVWKQATESIDLPFDEEDFLSAQGALQTSFDDRRQYRRFQLRSRAVIKHNDAFEPIYTKEVSRSGICFLSSVQLFPRERITTWLPNGTVGRVSIRRCHKIQTRCYEVGGLFSTEDVDDLNERISNLIEFSGTR